MDYRGEVKCCYYNPTNKEVFIESGERISQLVIAPYKKCEYYMKDKLNETDRGSGGFGSTGK